VLTSLCLAGKRGPRERGYRRGDTLSHPSLRRRRDRNQPSKGTKPPSCSPALPHAPTTMKRHAIVPRAMPASRDIGVRPSRSKGSAIAVRVLKRHPHLPTWGWRLFPKRANPASRSGCVLVGIFAEIRNVAPSPRVIPALVALLSGLDLTSVEQGTAPSAE
jgi:hypothetical protein